MQSHKRVWCQKNMNKSYYQCNSAYWADFLTFCLSLKNGRIVEVYLYCIIINEQFSTGIIWKRPTAVQSAVDIFRELKFMLKSFGLKSSQFVSILYSSRVSNFKLWLLHRRVIVSINHDRVVGLCSELLLRLTYYIQLAYGNSKKCLLVGIEPLTFLSWTTAVTASSNFSL